MFSISLLSCKATIIAKINASYWLKTVLFWNGVEGKLQEDCLENTMRCDSMCKVYDKLTMLNKLYTLTRAHPPPRGWGPRRNPIKPIGKSGTDNDLINVLYNSELTTFYFYNRGKVL